MYKEKSMELEGDLSTRKPKEKVPMTEREIETAESSTSPMWPTKMLVTELTPYWQMTLKPIGAAINHSFADSVHKTRFTSLQVLAGA